MKENSIPICRSVFNHWIYEDAEHLKVWITMLGRARYVSEPKIISYRDVSVTLQYGQFIFGYKQWEKDTGVSYQRLRTLVKRMKDDGMIQEIQTTSHFTVLFVVNYSKFNSREMPKTIERVSNENSQPTVSQQSANSQPTTNKEGNKKDKKDKDSISASGYDYFQDFWDEYPRKVAKANAKKAFAKLKVSDIESMRKIMLGLYACIDKQWKGKEVEFIPHPATWLNGRRWEDDIV